MTPRPNPLIIGDEWRHRIFGRGLRPLDFWRRSFLGIASSLRDIGAYVSRTNPLVKEQPVRDNALEKSTRANRGKMARQTRAAYLSLQACPRVIAGEKTAVITCAAPPEFRREIGRALRDP